MSHPRQAAQHIRLSSASPEPEAEPPIPEEDCLSASLQPPLTTAPHHREPPNSAAMLAAAAAAAAAADETSSGTEASGTVASKPKSGKLLQRIELPLCVIRNWWRDRRLHQIRKKECPPPVAYVAESNQDGLPEEDRRRLIQLVITNERVEVTENKVTRIREDNVIQYAIASFDFNFEDIERPGAPPFILVNHALLRDLGLDGLYEAYDDPENPPVVLTNPDGTKMKLLGELRAKWGAKGPINEYAGQQIFLNPARFHPSRCVVLPEASPYDVLIGLGTIKELKLNVPSPAIASLASQGQGQGGKRHVESPVNSGKYTLNC